MWRFNPVYSPSILELSKDLRHVKHKGAEPGSTDTEERDWGAALCSLSTQRTFTVRILRNPSNSNLEVGMFHLDGLYHVTGFKTLAWTLNMDYQLDKAWDHEKDEEYKGKRILEGSVVSVHIEDKRRMLTFKVNGEEVYSNVKTSLPPEKFSRLVAGVVMFFKDDEVEIIDPE